MSGACANIPMRERERKREREREREREERGWEVCLRVC